METIELINLFEEETGATVRDCISNERAYFLVEEGEAGLAIGKNGTNVKKLQDLLNKHVKVFEYSSDDEELVENLVPQAEEIDIEDNEVTVSVDRREKGRVIGKEGENIKILREFLRRNSELEGLDVE